MLSRFPIWLMLTVFVFNSLGFWVLIEWKQSEIREESAALIRKSNCQESLQVISVSKEQSSKMKWDEDGKEFCYNNNMYDVVRTEKKGNMVSYFCLADANETNFNAFLDQATKKDDVRERMPFQGAFKKMFVTFLYLLPGEMTSFVQANSSFELPSLTSLYSFDFYSEKSPPPRIGVV